MKKITRQNRRVMAALKIAENLIYEEIYKDRDYKTAQLAMVLAEYELDTTEAGQVERELRNIANYLFGRALKNGVHDYQLQKRQNEAGTV